MENKNWKAKSLLHLGFGVLRGIRSTQSKIFGTPWAVKSREVFRR